MAKRSDFEADLPVDWKTVIQRFETRHQSQKHEFAKRQVRVRRFRGDVVQRLSNRVGAAMRNGRVRAWLEKPDRLLQRLAASAPIARKTPGRSSSTDQRLLNAWRSRANEQNRTNPPPHCSVAVSQCTLVVWGMKCGPALALPFVSVSGDDGFALGANRAAKNCQTEYILFIHGGVEITPGAIEQMLQVLGNPKIGLVSTRVIRPDGTALTAGMKFYEDLRSQRFTPQDLASVVTVEAVGKGTELVAALDRWVLLCRREDFFKLGGFETSCAAALTGVDLSLRYRLDLGLDAVCLHDVTAKLCTETNDGDHSNDGDNPDGGGVNRRSPPKPLFNSDLSFSLRKTLLRDRLHGRCLWEDQPLTLGIIASNTHRDLKALLSSSSDCEIRRLLPDENGKVDCCGLHVLVDTTGQFDLDSASNKRPTLLTASFPPTGHNPTTGHNPSRNDNYTLRWSPTASKTQTPIRQLRDALVEFVEHRFQFAIKVAAPSERAAQSWGDYHFAKALQRCLIERGQAARVDILPQWYRPESLADDVVIALRGVKRYIPNPAHINIMWHISHPEGIKLGEFLQFDHVFVASQSRARELGNGKLGGRAETLLQAYDPSRFYRDEQPGTKAHDVLFVGNSRFAYRPIIFDALSAGLPLSVYGANWSGLLPDGVVKNSHVLNEELRRYYSGCKVLLNDHWDDMRRNGFISNRLFDAAACGTCIVTDPIAGVDEIFGDSVFTYETAEQLGSIVRRLLADDDLRRHHGDAARQCVQDSFDFDARAATIIARAKKIATHKGLRPPKG